MYFCKFVVKFDTAKVYIKWFATKHELYKKKYSKGKSVDLWLSIIRAKNVEHSLKDSTSEFHIIIYCHTLLK